MSQSVKKKSGSQEMLQLISTINCPFIRMLTCLLYGRAEWAAQPSIYKCIQVNSLFKKVLYSILNVIMSYMHSNLAYFWL